MMNEHPILFSTEMVRAILDGRKTMTRRIIKRGVVGRMMSGDQILWPYIYDKQGKSVAVPCPYGQPGDLLWVREAWKLSPRGNALYRADPAFGPDSYEKGWRPSIHMPRWASRITLEVTGVRVERVQDIAEADAVAEGVTTIYPTDEGKPLPVNDMIRTNGWGTVYPSAKAEFSYLWDKINAKRSHSWDSNPWVWVVEFKRTG